MENNNDKDDKDDKNDKTNKNDNFNEENYNETVLIEFDILYHLEFVIRNMINKFSDLKHTIICC